MTFSVKHTQETRGSFGDYRYGIYEEGTLIAHFWHDYRGDESGLEFVNGMSDCDPEREIGKFLEGGGSELLTLSKRAIIYINENRP
jgi:hypothetical protein